MLNSNVPTQLKDPKDPSKGVQLVTNVKSTDGAAPAGPQTLALMTAVNLPALINTVLAAIAKLWLAPLLTVTAPLGVMEPFAPALAVMV